MATPSPTTMDWLQLLHNCWTLSKLQRMKWFLFSRMHYPMITKLASTYVQFTDWVCWTVSRTFIKFSEGVYCATPNWWKCWTLSGKSATPFQEIGTSTTPTWNQTKVLASSAIM